MITTSITITANGRPRARLAAQIARYSNTPVCFTTLTMTIMPEQQEDDVPVDAGLLAEERHLGVDDPEDAPSPRPRPAPRRPGGSARSRSARRPRRTPRRPARWSRVRRPRGQQVLQQAADGDRADDLAVTVAVDDGDERAVHARPSPRRPPGRWRRGPPPAARRCPAGGGAGPGPCRAPASSRTARPRGLARPAPGPGPASSWT